MSFEQVEQLKRKLTDRYVVVDEGRPELRRFKGQTGRVKTVNMNGRALVEFDGNNNIGWYDIELDFLTVVDAPLPKPSVEEKPAKKAPATPAPEAKAAPATKKTPEAKGAASAASAAPAAKAAVGGKPSVADMLAAARGKGAGAPKAEAAAEAAVESKPAVKPATGKLSVADMLAAARGKGSPAASAPEPKAVASSSAAPPQKLSVAAMLAAARTKPGVAPADSGVPSAAQQLEAARVKPAAAKAAVPVAAAVAAPSAKLDPKKMSIAEMLASARGQGGASTSNTALAPPVAVVAPAAEEASAVEEAAPAEVAPASAPAQVKKIDRSKMSVAEMIAYARQADAK